ncbi:MAG: hypothetical protein LBK71_11700 [Verrucomicrobiales bacterium]|jgi:hypothetical protein|nr:hypothetical protein [Verrucomicrobiales bacterium]
MKAILLITLLAVTTSFAVVQTKNNEIKKPVLDKNKISTWRQVTLADGTVEKWDTIYSIKPYGIGVGGTNGVKTIYFKSLPEKLQKEIGYNSAIVAPTIPDVDIKPIKSYDNDITRLADIEKKLEALRETNTLIGIRLLELGSGRTSIGDSYGTTSNGESYVITSRRRRGSSQPLMERIEALEKDKETHELLNAKRANDETARLLWFEKNNILKRKAKLADNP